MSAQIQYGRVDPTTPEQTLALPAPERFACAVRLGRRKSDPGGRLVMTAECLHFRGARDIEVVWAAIARIDLVDRAIVISLRNTRRILHFCCSTAEEAAVGSAMAQELMSHRAPDVITLA